jgi:predicted RNA-binding protein associated with RNAse of E/G family
MSSEILTFIPRRCTFNIKAGKPACGIRFVNPKTRRRDNDMANPILYRKRLIPEECVLLKDDRLLYRDEEIIVTAWNTLKPRKDLHHGLSCYYLGEGIKVSRFYDENDSLLYWYCDIVDYDYYEETDTYIITDLLADVIIYPDGFVKVVDIGELADAREAGLLNDAMLKKALLTLNRLLQVIYDGGFEKLQAPLEKYG